MAFSIHSLQLITDIAHRETWAPLIPIVCMGYPDVLIAPEILQAKFTLPAKLKIREDSEAVMAWHGLKMHDGGEARVVESTWLLRALGFEPSYIDITPARGGEIIVDMNEPIPEDLRGKFKIVYDAGGLEHYFNVGQGVRNILDMCDVGGIIFHGNPHIACNHGFYNFCPTFYYDFYHQNGHRLMGGATLLQNGVPAGDVQFTGRYMMQRLGETWIQVLVRKQHDKPAKWPMQSKYVQNPMLQGRLQ